MVRAGGASWKWAAVRPCDGEGGLVGWGSVALVACAMPPRNPSGFRARGAARAAARTRRARRGGLAPSEPTSSACPTARRSRRTPPRASVCSTLDPHLREAPWVRASGAVRRSPPTASELALATSGYNRLFDEAGAASSRPRASTSSSTTSRAGRPARDAVLRVPEQLRRPGLRARRARCYVERRAGRRGARVRARRPGDHGRSARRRSRSGTSPGGARRARRRAGPLRGGARADSLGRALVVAKHENDAVTIVRPPDRRRWAQVALTPRGGGGASSRTAWSRWARHGRSSASQRDARSSRWTSGARRRWRGAIRRRGRSRRAWSPTARAAASTWRTPAPTR